MEDKLSPEEEHRLITEKLLQDPTIKALAEEGKRYLDSINRPNIITLEQFMPFQSLFLKRDPNDTRPIEEYDNDQSRLFEKYRRDLNINLYEPTIVIASETDRTELYFLDRRFTRIRSDINPNSERNKLISRMPNTPLMSQNDKILAASFIDITAANTSDEAMQNFALKKVESAIINARFYKENLSAEAKEDIESETVINKSFIVDDFYEDEDED